MGSIADQHYHLVNIVQIKRFQGSINFFPVFSFQTSIKENFFYYKRGLGVRDGCEEKVVRS